MNEIVNNNSETKENNKEIVWDLKDLRTDIINQKLNNLEISKSSKQVLDLLKNKPDWTKTNMYTKLEKLEWDDFNIEKFSNEIDKTIKKYLYQSLIDSGSEFKVDDKVIDSLSVWIQFSMMKALADSGKDWSDFFSNFSEIKTDNFNGVIDWLFSVLKWKSWILWKVGKANEFYVLANKFQNCIWYISYNSGKWKESKIWDGSQIVELTNPSKFVKLLESPVWDNQQWLFGKKMSEVWLSKIEEGWNIEMTNEDKVFLQGIADNVNMPIDKKTINAIKNAIPTAQNLLEKRLTFKDNISGIVEKVWWMLNINLFWFGTIWSLLGIKSLTDFLRGEKWKKKWILDFILTGMWFQWWVEWLHREYVRKNIDENLDSDEKKDFISQMYTYYNKEKESEYKWKTTIDKLWLSKMDEWSKNKIPNKYDLLKQSLLENVKWNEKLINPLFLTKYGLKDCLVSEKYVDGNWKEKIRTIVDESKLDKSKINNEFIDKYLSDSFKELVSDEKFMNDIENSDQFTLALMWKFVAGNWFVEWVVIWEELTDNYLVKKEEVVWFVPEKAVDDKKTEELKYSGWDQEIVQRIDGELKKYNSLIKSEDVLGASKQHNVPVEYIMAFMKNDSSYATAWKWARTNNPWNIWNDDAGNEKNYNSLRDWVYALWQHLRWRIDEYKKVYWLVLMPTAKELADNIWRDGKWFLSNQGNYKKANTERKWAYMTAKSWWSNVNNFTDDLASIWITNYWQVA